MIYPQTMLTVADNTGARKIMCIRILGGNRKYAKIGDTIIGVVKEAIPNMPIKRSDIVRAIVVRTCKTIRRPDGMLDFPSSSLNVGLFIVQTECWV